MGIEAKINYQLNKYPAAKKVIKRAYQRIMYAVSPKIKSEGNIVRVSPDDPQHEYFFGYYDKSPWDITDRYMLCLKANDTWSDVSPKEPAQIILIDTKQDNKITVLAETHSWNVQQGCMLQWLGLDYKYRIIFNDCREGKYCSVILKLEFPENGGLDGLEVTEEKVIPAPVYSVAADGTFALTLDFSRLYRLRPGYGYYNVPESTADEKLPDKPCIWRVDLVSGKVTPVLKYTDFANFQPRPEMEGAEHKVNHIMLSPSGKRFMVLYRWFAGQRKYTRLITCNVDGTDMYVLSDDDMISHCFWRNNKQIFAFENKKECQKGDKVGSGYYLMKDKTQEYRRFWSGIDYDGHPSYSPDGSMVVFDRYPDRARVAAVMVSDAKNRKDSGVRTVARVFAPFKYDNDTRCDLHPRWNRAGDKICFDSVFEGHRGLYVADVPTDIFPLKKERGRNIDASVDIKEQPDCSEEPLISVIVPVYQVEKYLRRCTDSILSQTYKNLEIILVDDGSTDNSGKLCDEIASLDSRVKVIHKENGGLSSARNAGLEIAAGEYIGFVDSDDWIEPDTYEYMLSLVEANQADIVDIDCQYAYDADDAVTVTVEREQVYRQKDALWRYLYRGLSLQKNAPYSACRKLYRRDVIGNVTFPEGKNSEDLLFNYKVIKKCSVLVESNQVKYHYFQNNAGISLGPLKKKDLALLEICENINDEERNNAYRNINILTRTKLARSYFSILARIALSGCSEEIDNPKELTKDLTGKLRKNLMLLMKSPIAWKRKILILVFAVDYRILSKPYSFYKKIVKG